MKTVILLLIMTTLLSCKERVSNEIKLEEKENDSTLVLKPFSNPCNIYGSTFGAFLQSLLRKNNYQLILNFTSNSSKQELGTNAILNFYKNDFVFDYELGKLSNVTKIKDTIKLTYANSSIYATRRKIVLNCILENDSIKLLLKRLDCSVFN